MNLSVLKTTNVFFKMCTMQLPRIKYTCSICNSKCIYIKILKNKQDQSVCINHTEENEK